MIYLLTLDPHSKFYHIDEISMSNMVGFIPSWLSDATHDDLSAQECLDRCYGFGLYESKEASITKEGIYQYEGDPDLFPLIKIERGDEIVYVYEYALVAIINAEGSSFCCRMD